MRSMEASARSALLRIGIGRAGYCARSVVSRGRNVAAYCSHHGHAPARATQRSRSAPPDTITSVATRCGAVLAGIVLPSLVPRAFRTCEEYRHEGGVPASFLRAFLRH